MVPFQGGVWAGLAPGVVEAADGAAARGFGGDAHGQVHGLGKIGIGQDTPMILQAHHSITIQQAARRFIRLRAQRR